jgi:hypothetical protein
MLILGAGSASAQTSQFAGAAAISTKPFGSVVSAPIVSAVSTTQNMFSNAVGAVFGTRPDPQQAEIARVARESAWLRSAGWPLYALVDRFSAGAPLSEEANCIAVAVYHEARGESLEGQLAVARVIMNRAASGKYPPTWCGTVKQPWQFSFVRNYQFPYTDKNCDAWRKAVGVTRLAMANAYPSVDQDVLWYHADYVSPSWGRRLSRVAQIGTHIFYSA